MDFLDQNGTSGDRHVFWLLWVTALPVFALALERDTKDKISLLLVLFDFAEIET